MNSCAVKKLQTTLNYHNENLLKKLAADPDIQKRYPLDFERLSAYQLVISDEPHWTQVTSEECMQRYSDSAMIMGESQHDSPDDSAQRVTEAAKKVAKQQEKSDAT